MEIIKSFDNKTVKHLNKLKQKKYRDEYGEFFVEGRKNAVDTCAARRELIKSVVLSESAHAESFCELFADFPVTVLSDSVFERVSDTQSSQGVIAVVEMPVSQLPIAERCILLDRVRDPGNVGTILRTAVACGHDVVLNNCADVFAPKVARSAMSAIVKCRIGIDISAAELKSRGYEIIVADMHGENVFDAKPSDRYCIVIGNEADGVSAENRALADRLLSVPQSNMESLNAAVAAGIMMFGLRYGNSDGNR